jgi:hypothetical protein
MRAARLSAFDHSDGLANPSTPSIALVSTPNTISVINAKEKNVLFVKRIFWVAKPSLFFIVVIRCITLAWWVVSTQLSALLSVDFVAVPCHEPASLVLSHQMS